MKFTTSLLPVLLVALPSASLAFSPSMAAPAASLTRSSSSTPSSWSRPSVRLSSTLAPEAPTRTAHDDDDDNNNESTFSTKRPTLTPQSMQRHLDEQLQTLLPKKAAAATEAPAPPATGAALSMSMDDLATVLGGRGRAQIVWDCYNVGVDPAGLFGSVIKLGWDDYESVLEMLPSSRRLQRLGPETVAKLASLYQGQYGSGVKKVEGGVASLSYISRSASDGTTKLLLKMSDGLEVETVIIPWKGKRSTLCVSSQVGCRQGCTFCATGKMGRIRNLTADEILAQMYWAKKMCRLEGLPEVSNVVFMGMGEPSDNAANVILAAERLTTREMFSLSASRVTVSTVGPTPEAFMDFARARCVLAWSVHAVNDDLRRRLVPTTRHSMVELRQGFIDALLTRPMNARTCMLEVALMRGVNDGPDHADDLADFTQAIVDQVPGVKPHINLIPYNDIGGVVHQSPSSSSFERPSREDVAAFQARLQAKGLHVNVRTTRGDDKTAACGQLSTARKTTSKMP